MKNMFRYVLPIWLAMTVNTLLGITDMYFINLAGSEYITAIGIAGTPFSILSTLFIGIGIAANRNTASGKKVDWNTTIFVIVIFSFIVSGLAFVLSDYIFFYAGGNEMYAQVLDYFNIYVFSLVPSAILYLCTGILRGKGESDKTLWFSCEAVVLNFILDFLFIQFNLSGSALKGCAAASLLSDTLTAVTYMVYMTSRRKDGFVCYDKICIKRIVPFLRNSFSYSLEKLFSTSTLTVLSSIYLALLTVGQSRIYYGLDKMYSPVLMLAYSYFEWVIYARAKQIQNNRRQNYFLFLCLCAVDGMISVIYLDLSIQGILFCLLYATYHILFFVEREYVAILFEKGKDAAVNKVMLGKSIVLIGLLQIEVVFHVLNIFSIIGTQLMLLLGCIMIFVRKERQVMK